jgi:metallo-beta-lactamase family protein
MATLQFCGAASTVTGSCSHLITDNARFLIDTGMFQGNKTTRKLNYEPFPFEVEEVDFVILTHAHIDHSGLLPKLVKNGFTGPIYATPATVDLLQFMLLDGASIQESSTERSNKIRLRKGLEPYEQPLYTTPDAEDTLKLLRPIEYETWFEPKPGIKARFWNAGHMLGSASAELQIEDKKTDAPIRMLFSGDIGPDEKVFHAEPTAPEGFDYIICESTYGDRERDDYSLASRREALRKELNEGLAAGGNVIIPSFAVERSQELLHDIGYLSAHNLIPKAEIYVDSPLASKVTGIFMKYASTLEDIEVNEEDLFRQANLKMVTSVEESKAVNKIKGGAIVISASGMCDAGRIQHHLKSNIWRKESTILFVGFQSPGTLGHIITSGAESVRIHGEEFKINARIRRLGNYSAHADQSELLHWVLERAPIVSGLFLNHGEDDAREGFKTLLAANGVDAEKIHLPNFDERFELRAGSAKSKGQETAPRIEEKSLVRDWANDYAALVLELSSRMQRADNDAERRELLEKLQKAMR